MILRELRKLVEIHVDDLAHGWWHASFGHDHQFVWSKPDYCCDFPIAPLMRQDNFSWEVGKLNLRRRRAFLVVAHRLM